MENAEKVNDTSITDNKMIMTANEVANVLGESYKTVAKRLNTLASQGEITVTEKSVNNRVLKGYVLSVADLQVIKDKFIKNKHLEIKENARNIQMLENPLKTTKNNDLENEMTESPNVKFYEVVQKNAELTKELDKLKADMQSKINENVRLDADLSMARSELKYITDKSSSMESAYAEQNLEVERLNKVVRNRNTALIFLGAVLLIIITVAVTLSLFVH